MPVLDIAFGLAVARGCLDVLQSMGGRDDPGICGDFSGALLIAEIFVAAGAIPIGVVALRGTGGGDGRGGQRVGDVRERIPRLRSGRSRRHI